VRPAVVALLALAAWLGAASDPTGPGGNGRGSGRGSGAAAAEARRPEMTVALLHLRGQPASPRPRALSSLLAAVARRTAVNASADPPPVVALADPALFDSPLVLLAGDTGFEPLDEAELDVLTTYLSLGGMVIVDDSSGGPDSDFSRRAREELSRATGGRTFQPLPPDHAIYRSYYLLDRAWGRVDVTPRLEAIVMDGRAAVVHSRNDLAGAWARDELGTWAHPVTPGGSRQRELAIRLGVNLVLYSLTLDYKEDLVHLPLILERRK
jgi:hypothetical protein